MIRIYWNRAEGSRGDEKEIIKFDNDPNRLSEIYSRLLIKDYSFLGDFFKKFGPEIEFSGDNVNETLHDALISLGKKMVEEKKTWDLYVMEAVKFYIAVEKMENEFKQHIRDIFDLVDPFLKFELDENEFIKKIMSMDYGNFEIMKYAVENFKEISELKKKIELYIEGMMERNAPNISKIAGPLLGAQLIYLANGMENLSSYPGSRIQILGAGRAMYMSRKKKLPGPKHGIIFKHPLVHGSRDRGKMARRLANKIAIAARVDYYREIERYNVQN